MPRKRNAAAEAAGDAEQDPESKIVVEAVKDEVEEEEEEEKKPKKRAKKTKEPVNEEPHVALEGPKWTIHPPWLMYRSVKANFDLLLQRKKNHTIHRGLHYLGLCMHLSTCLQR